ncbi:MAG: hypothetical protein DLM68_14155 [Hyphomicrobiales bacterium]|nr:MAG: hypothetical protein DLM68_14155 [Hyphomicrobiales bacterium]
MGNCRPPNGAIRYEAFGKLLKSEPGFKVDAGLECRLRKAISDLGAARMPMEKALANREAEQTRKACFHGSS